MAALWKNGRRAGNSGVMLAVLAAVVIKTIAAKLPLIALRGPSRPARDRTVRVPAEPKPQS